MKKAVRILINAVSIVIIVFSLFILLTVIMTGAGRAPSLMGISMFRVVTGSMEPTLPVDTLIFVHHVDPEDVREGDIVSFYSRDPTLNGAVNTHRVVDIWQENGEIVYTTRGDANLVDDKYPTYSSDVIGVVFVSFPILGKIMHFMEQPMVFFPVLIIPVLVMLLSNLLGTIRLTRQLAAEIEAPPTASKDSTHSDSDGK